MTEPRQHERDGENDNGMSRQAGRPLSLRFPYLHPHPEANTKTRILQSRNHNNLPDFIGKYFPHRDDPTSYTIYCAAMLVLLKPWRNIANDLK